MGGETAFGGSEVVTVMTRAAADDKGRFAYRLLATNKTSTMQREMQEAGDAGAADYQFVGLTVADTSLVGRKWSRFSGGSARGAAWRVESAECGVPCPKPGV